MGSTVYEQIRLSGNDANGEGPLIRGTELSLYIYSGSRLIGTKFSKLIICIFCKSANALWKLMKMAPYIDITFPNCDVNWSKNLICNERIPS